MAQLHNTTTLEPHSTKKVCLKITHTFPLHYTHIWNQADFLNFPKWKRNLLIDSQTRTYFKSYIQAVS